MRLFPLVLAASLICAATARAGSDGTPRLDFARDVLPILSGKCFTCHGPDKEGRKAGLRLDLRAFALRKGRSGDIVIQPGKPSESELVRRIRSHEPSESMPPPTFKKKLTEAEKNTLERWIAEGAEYKLHWAYVKPTRPTPPTVKDATWGRNAIDAFILARLEQAKLRPSREAVRATLIRRLSFDLRGLPPSLEEVDAFLKDTRPNAYERLVDQMLASPHYGEKMAQLWLDLARYGDTSGFHQDSTRHMWLWRDWVINAFNDNMPYSRFTIEQIAGDLLPRATVSQKIASGFHRNTRFNEEGGVDPEEFVVRYGVDRVSTVGQIWMGLTVGCAECHDHKYDPLSQKEFYQLYAYFSGLKDPMVSMNHNQPLPPILKVPTPEQEKELAKLNAELAELEEFIQQELSKIDYKDPHEGKTEKELPPREAKDFVWVDDDVPAGAKTASDPPDSFKWIIAPEALIHRGKRSMVRTGIGLHQHFFQDAKEPLPLHKGDRFFAHVWIDPDDAPKMLMFQWYDGRWEHRAFWGEDRTAEGGLPGTGARTYMGPMPETGKWVRLEIDVAKVGFKPGSQVTGWAFSQHSGTVFYDHAGVKSLYAPDEREADSFRLWMSRNKTNVKLPSEVRDLLQRDETKRTEKEVTRLRQYFLQHVYLGAREMFADLEKERIDLRRKIDAVEAAVPHTMVSEEMDTPRPAHVLHRGDFLQKGEKVERGLPAVFASVPHEGPNNRLGLAQWLVHPDHPLTARVAVNRFWAQLFGNGIVPTIGDFGVQGEQPSHPELLDWLAVEFIEKGWDVKHLLRTIALSSTYRQSSVFPDELPKADPGNRLLSRMPRFRLTAEEVRDNALAISGLLTRKLGGPPTMPYQPPDYYRGKYEGWMWAVSKGEDQHRRGLYTFWRRTALHPMFALFDAPTREDCTSARPRTNTALQALVTLNDPTFVEAARVFAQRILSEGPADTEGRITFAFRSVLARAPEAAEVKVLKRMVEQALTKYQKDPDAASRLVHAGQSPRLATLNESEHAAWTTVASVLLNLDETITRE